MDKNNILKLMGIEVYRLREPEGSDDTEQLPDDFKLLKSSTTERKSEIGTMDFLTLQTTVANCTNCTLSQHRTNTVFGSGNENTDILFIGEGPGAEEDRQGLPFVGKAGQLLESMIHALGYEREQVYITNIVKCRPPQNRDPTHIEAKSCAPYLRRQIELIEPRVMIALGRVAAQLLLDTEQSLSKLRSKIYKYRSTDIDLIVTYHPAYLLRKPTEKEKSWEDLWEG